MIPVSQMRKLRLGEAQEFAGEREVTQLVLILAGAGLVLSFRPQTQGRKEEIHGGMDGDAGQKSKTG